MSRFLLLLATFRIADAAAADHGHTCGSVVDICPQGCWHESGIVNHDGSRKCAQVGSGYFSPRNDNGRYQCEPGTFSNQQYAELCTSCPAGTHSSSEGSSECSVCPSETFSGIPGSTYCGLCDSKYYSGDGANSAQVFGGQLYCVLLTDYPTASPTAQPSMHSSSSPTTSPSEGPSSQTPTLTSDETLALAEGSAQALDCNDDAFFLHGACMQCPSRTMAILLPILVVLFVIGATLFLIKMAPCCTAVLFIGIEYLQLLFLLGITHVPWTGTLEELYRFLGIFALDLNAAVPLQCYLDLNPQGEHVLILILPIIGLALPLVWIRAHLHNHWFTKDEGRAKRRTCVNNFAFWIYLGYAKLLLTSLEAMSCSTLQAGVFSEETIDWFCLSSGSTNDKYAAMIGAAGLVSYGMVYPVWVVQNLNRAHAANHKETAGEIANVPDKSLFWTGRQHFLRPFQPSAWWWTAFLLGRKFILVCGVILFQDVPFLTLAFFPVLIIISQTLQRRNPPYIDHEETISENSKTRAIFRFKTVDMVLHACLIYATAFGMIFLLVSETADARVGLAILLLLVLVPSFVYLLLAVCRCLSHGWQSMTDADDFDPENPKSLTKKTARNAKHQTSKSTDSKKSVSFEHPHLSSNITAHTLSTRAPRPSSLDDETEYDDRTEEGVENTSGGAHCEPGRWASQVSEASMGEWQETEDYDNWVATDGSAMVSSFEEQQRTDEEDYDRQQSGHARISIRKNHSSMISAGDESGYGTWSIDDIGDAEEDANEHVFADDDTVQSDWDGESQAATEVWIDEDTGLPVDRYSGQWTDAETGQSLNSSLMTTSEEEEYNAALARSKSTLIVAPCDRMEPSTWGRRQSSVYRPSE
jgi:hypothetical protein